VVTGLRHAISALHFNLGGASVLRSSGSGHVSGDVKPRRNQACPFLIWPRQLLLYSGTL